VNPHDLSVEALHHSPLVAVGREGEVYVSWSSAKTKPPGALFASDLRLSRSKLAAWRSQYVGYIFQLYNLVAVLTARSMLATTSGVVVLHADLRRPLSILDQIRSTAVPALDLSRPVALILGGVLGCLADADAYLAVTHLGTALARGSYLVITHATPRLLDQAAPAAARSAVAVLRRTPTRLRLRGYADVARFFNGWTLTAPGLIEAARWRLHPHEPTHKGLAYPDGAVLAGVARKTRLDEQHSIMCHCPLRSTSR